MSRLPESVAASLAALGAGGSPAETAGAVRDLLCEVRRFDDLARAFEAFREAVRSFGILDESRSGERVHDGWSKLSRFFMGSMLTGDGASLAWPGAAAAPPGHEALGARWERLLPEIEAFLAEEKSLDEALGQAPVSAGVAYKFRSRFLVLDRRAERIQVVSDLIRRDLTAAAAAGLERAAGQGGRAGGRRGREARAEKDGEGGA